MTRTRLGSTLGGIALLALAALPVAAGGADEAAAAPGAAIARGVAVLLARQEGEGEAEWPYEGVYRVRGAIPIGYRVGGTGIVGCALLRAPEAEDADERRAALERALRFVTGSVAEPLMATAEIEATYDVRGWGWAYGLAFLCEAESRGAIPEPLREEAAAAARFFIEGIAATEIPRHGGWNYARRAGFDAPGAPSPFMTASTLLALYAAAERGYAVDPAMVERGLDALEAARTPAGAYVYAGSNGARGREATPGSVGRMLAAESALLLGGRGEPDRVRAAIDAFIVHWEWLEKRRRQSGTHVPPYGIAPYYFYYAHWFAALAVELLPAVEQPEYRRRVQETIMRTRDEEGGWNDRVFDRSAAYGTAMAIMGLGMADAPPPARWSPPEAESEVSASPGDAAPR